MGETLKQCSEMRGMEFALKDAIVRLSEEMADADMLYITNAVELAQDHMRRAAAQLHGAADICLERERESRAVCCGRRVA